jgi:ubiquinone/menaquinone biosynthesis C-methylase UbiE
MRLYRRLRDLVRPGEAVAVPAETGDSEPAVWEPADEETAMREVLNTTDPEEFERSGREQFDALRPLVPSRGVVLDLGCGIGRVARYVAPHCRELWAIDSSEKMLGFAQRRLAALENVRYARCAGTSIPLPDATLDLAYSVLTLQHMEREHAFMLLRELHRVIRPGGAVYLTFPNLLSDAYLESFLGYVDGGEVANPRRARFYTQQEVERLLPAAGLRISDCTVGTEIVVVCGPA